MKQLYFMLLVLPFFVKSGKVFGQTSSSIDNPINEQLWIDFYPNFSINNKLDYYGDFGYRVTIDGQTGSRVHMRPSLRYHFSSIVEAHTGIGIFYNYDLGNFNQFEIRPWQGIKINGPIWGQFEMNNFFRIEERIVYLTEDWSSTFDFRFRYKLSGKYDFRPNDSGAYWQASIYAEIFLQPDNDVNEFFREQVRMGLGGGFNPSSNWNLTLVLNIFRSRKGVIDEIRKSDVVYQLKIKRYWSK